MSIIPELPELSEPTKTAKITAPFDLTEPCETSGQHIFGATFNRNQFDISLSEKDDETNLNQLRKYLPQLADSLTKPISSHAAIRITTPDRYPYVGAIPDVAYYKQEYADLHHGKHWKKYPDAQYHKGLFINAAYGSRGLTTAGLCADILACIIDGEQPEIDARIVQAIHPARFLVRSLQRKQGRNT